MPKVLNKRDGMPDGAVYVGRPSKWGNPFQVGRDGDRAEVIRKFTMWLLERPMMLASTEELRGKDLVCWCSPEPCHADVLLKIANADPVAVLNSVFEKQ